MRELELKEKKIKEIQNTGDRLLRDDHPARPTVEVGAAGRPLVPTVGRGLRGPPGPWAGADRDARCAAVLPGSAADPVELDAAAVLLHRGPPEGEHRLLPGESPPRPAQPQRLREGPRPSPWPCASPRRAHVQVPPGPSGPHWGSPGRSSLTPSCCHSSSQMCGRRRSSCGSCRRRWAGSTPATAPSPSLAWRTCCRTPR